MATKNLKLRVLVNPDFAWAMSQIINAQVPAKAAYWLSKCFRKIESHQKAFEEARLKTLKKYAETEKAPDGSEQLVLDEKTKEAKFKSDEARATFIKEVEELLDQEVEVLTVSFSLFGDDSKIETRQLLILDEVIVSE